MSARDEHRRARRGRAPLGPATVSVVRPPEPQLHHDGHALPPALRAVHAEIVSCDRCPRLLEYCQRIGREKRRAYRNETYWARPVPGFGDPRARLLIVGLAPAAHGANRTGRVFTGDGPGGSGDFLMSALHRAGFANQVSSDYPGDGLTLRDAFIATAVRCAPPDNRPTREEIATCLSHLEAEIDALPHVRVLVALGRIAFDACLRLLHRRRPPIRPRPPFAHASIARMPTGHTVVACYHPSRQNTHTGRLTAAMMDAAFDAARLALGTS